MRGGLGSEPPGDAGGQRRRRGRSRGSASGAPLLGDLDEEDVPPLPPRDPDRAPLPFGATEEGEGPGPVGRGSGGGVVPLVAAAALDASGAARGAAEAREDDGERRRLRPRPRFFPSLFFSFAMQKQHVPDQLRRELALGGQLADGGDPGHERQHRGGGLGVADGDERRFGQEASQAAAVAVEHLGEGICGSVRRRGRGEGDDELARS